MKRKQPIEGEPYRRYTVSRKDREPLLEFILESLEASGCRIIRHSEPDLAPFKLSFETPGGERMGVVAYAFFANNRKTKNRPPDEYRFQLKYGSKTGEEHELWQDPYGIYTTLLVGINPEEQFFVGADPELHNPTKHFISVEFKERNVEEIQKEGWGWWERRKRWSKQHGQPPIEVLVGGRPESFLDYVRFEREALGEDQGHRALLAERPDEIPRPPGPGEEKAEESPYVHTLAKELELTPSEVLDLIASAKRLKMAVRGWVAEEHLVRRLRTVEGVSDCNRIEQEGGADVRLRFEGSSPLLVECKNVLRETNKAGLARVDFMRTRTSKGDPCTRYYSPNDFQVVAACLHALTRRWEYSFALTGDLDPHKHCKGKLHNRVLVDERWNQEIRGILGEAVRRG